MAHSVPTERHHVKNSEISCFIYASKLKYIGRSRGHAWHMPLPLWDPILSFWHTFSAKSTRVGSPHSPPMGPRPLREMLDPPLKQMNVL